MNVTGPQIYFTIPGIGITVNQTMVSSFVVMLLLCGAGIFLGHGLQKRPTGRQVLAEKAVTTLRDLVIEAMGEHNVRWVPYIGTLFMSSLLGSLIGMTGFFRSTTADLSTTATWAVMTSILCWYFSIKNLGLGPWLKGFTDPIVVMTPMNIISEIAQPVSLAFRHFGNVVGGSVITTMVYWALSGASTAVLGLVGKGGYIGGGVLLVLGILLFVRHKKRGGAASLVFSLVLAGVGIASLLDASHILPNIPILQIGLPAVLSLYFDLFSGLIQAFVFSLLSMIYISNACPPPEEAAA